MLFDLENLNEEELLLLNREVAKRVKDIQRSQDMASCQKFRLGDIVSFKKNDGTKATGFIVSLRKEKVSVMTEARETWNLPARFVSLESQASKTLLDFLAEIFPQQTKKVEG